MSMGLLLPLLLIAAGAATPAVGPAVESVLGLFVEGTEAQFATSNKLLSKKLLRGAGIPTAPWVGLADRASTAIEAGQRYIVKSVWEHASVGLDEESVLTPTSTAELNDTLRARRAELGGDCFAERFIEGREFNLSVLGGPDGPQVLPPAEIDFSAYPEGKMRVVGFRAKWDESSFEYLHTPRTFDFAGEDALLGRLMDLARQSWRLFELRGHARVDFRVDRAGEPWVLEVNNNPCISPDAGFIAAAGRAGLSIDDVLRRIIADSMP